jgi:hypothetical protein
MKVALIQDFKVQEVKDIAAEDFHNFAKVNQAAIDVTNFDPIPQVGWDFDGQQILIPAGSNSRKITRLALRNRFTMTELAGIYTAAKANVMFQIYLDSLASATFIDLARADTIANVTLLGQVNLLTQARVNEILNNEIQEIERYRG